VVKKKPCLFYRWGFLLLFSDFAESLSWLCGLAGHCENKIQKGEDCNIDLQKRNIFYIAGNYVNTDVVSNFMAKTLLALVLFSLLSCLSNKQQDPNIGIYFSTAVSSLATFKQKHNKLMDSTTMAINKMFDTYDAKIDTNGLRILLESAKQADFESIETIKDLKEVDTSINFKDKCHDYMNEANNYYNNYFDKLIFLTKTPRQSDSLATLHSISSEIKVLTKKNEICVNAYEDFKAKYRVQVTLNFK
jgi:hypothetical protein